MQLVLERCALRPWRLDDAESLARHANNRKIWLGVRDLFPHPYTIQDAHEFLRRTISEASATNFCIEIEGAAVGGIGVHPGEDVHRHTATVGYWLGEEFWGRGIMTEAEVFANNPASARVLEKAGFTSEGCLKNDVLKDGKLLDSLLYARTK
jgi:[ribosomal protein S5]-alanine N-acetyltransferase